MNDDYDESIVFEVFAFVVIAFVVTMAIISSN